MKRKAILAVALLLAAWATMLRAGDVSLRIDVATKEQRVVFTVVVENDTDQTINLMPRLSKGTNSIVSSSLSWRVNDVPAEFLPKRALLMYPPFDTKVLPPHSTNAVARVEDDELFIVSQTTNTNIRVGHPALPSAGNYTIEVLAVGDWGGHTGMTASATIKMEKSPTFRPIAGKPGSD